MAKLKKIDKFIDIAAIALMFLSMIAFGVTLEAGYFVGGLLCMIIVELREIKNG